MPVGTLQNIVVCVPENSATASQQVVCPRIGGQYYVPTQLQAYVLDPAQQAAIDAASSEFDYAYASGVWALAFSMVVGLYFASHGIGLVLGMVRRG